MKKDAIEQHQVQKAIRLNRIEMVEAHLQQIIIVNYN